MKPGKRNKKQAMWGFHQAELRKNEAVMTELGLHTEVAIVLLNIRAQLKSLIEDDNNVIWGIKDGPIPLGSDKINKGRFHAIRLGLIEISEPSIMVGRGQGRKTRYKISYKWTGYDKNKPGKFLREEKYAPAPWKKCFNKDGTWTDDYLTPQARRRAPNKARKNNKPIFTSKQLSINTSKQSKKKNAEKQSLLSERTDRPIDLTDLVRTDNPYKLPVLSTKLTAAYKRYFPVLVHLEGITAC